MKHLIFILSLIIGLATSVSAKVNSYEIGDVLFCHMDDFLQWDPKDNQFHKRDLEKFKFTIVDEKTVKFGSASSIFSNREYFLERWWESGNPSFRAYSYSASIVLTDRGKFNYVASGTNPIMIMATCDRF